LQIVFANGWAFAPTETGPDPGMGRNEMATKSGKSRVHRAIELGSLLRSVRDFHFRQIGSHGVRSLDIPEEPRAVTCSGESHSHMKKGPEAAPMDMGSKRQDYGLSEQRLLP